MKRCASFLSCLLGSSFFLGASCAAPGPNVSPVVAPAAKVKSEVENVLLPLPNSPLVAMRVVFRHGSAADTPGKEGLAALTAAMIAEGGAADHTYAQLLDALYPMAGSISYHVEKDITVFWGMVHRDRAAAYGDLLSQQLTAPRFAEDDFARNKQAAVDFVSKNLRGNDDEELGKEALAALMYRDHPYGHPSAGTVSGIESITLQDVRDFYRAYYTRQNAIMGLAGGFPAALAQRFTVALEAGLPAAGRTLAPLPKRTIAPAGMRVLVVDKKAPATAISMGHPIDVSRNDDDFYPLFVAASYLGEHRTFNGVLMQNMRGKRGLNYGDYAYVENFVQDGWSTFPLPNIGRRQQHFAIWIRPVASQNALFAMRQALFETERLYREGIPQAGFAATVAFLRRYSQLWTQDISRRLGYAIDARIYGKDIIEELAARLPVMTKDDVDQALRRHIDVAKIYVAVVSDAGEAFAQTLLSGEPSPIVYDTAGTPGDILAEDLLIERYALPAGATMTQVVPVDEMFDGTVAD